MKLGNTLNVCRLYLVKNKTKKSAKSFERYALINGIYNQL